MSGLISVIIPTRDRADLLEAALTSVADQDYRPLEVLVIDDRSTDDTPAVVGRFDKGRGAGDLRIRYERLDCGGAAAARNRGLDFARGDLVQFLDSDDLLLEGALSRRAGALDRHPEVDVVHGDWLQGQSVASAATFKRRTFPDLPVALLDGYWLPNFSYLARRAAVERTGPWDEDIEVADDYEFLMRLAIGSTCMHVPGLTGFYRWHRRPRLSRRDRATYLRARMLVLERTEALMRGRRALTPGRRRSLLACYRRLAADALGESDGALDELRLRIRRLREETGAPPDALEALLGFEGSLWIRKRVFRLPRAIRQAVVGRIPSDTRRSLRTVTNRLTSAIAGKV